MASYRLWLQHRCTTWKHKQCCYLLDVKMHNTASSPHIWETMIPGQCPMYPHTWWISRLAIPNAFIIYPHSWRVSRLIMSRCTTHFSTNLMNIPTGYVKITIHFSTYLMSIQAEPGDVQMHNTVLHIPDVYPDLWCFRHTWCISRLVMLSTYLMKIQTGDAFNIPDAYPDWWCSPHTWWISRLVVLSIYLMNIQIGDALHIPD